MATIDEILAVETPAFTRAASGHHATLLHYVSASGIARRYAKPNYTMPISR